MKIFAPAILLLMGFNAFAQGAFAQGPNQLAAKINSGEITSVIFDVNGVLLTRNRIRSITCLGKRAIAGALLRGERFWSKKNILERLSKVSCKYDGTPLIHDGLPMPGVMVDWLMGESSSDEILERCRRELKPREILPEILNLMFSPILLTYVHDSNPDAIALLKVLRKKKLSIFVLSNMDMKTAELMKLKFPSIFDPMQGIMWSAEVHYVKPNPNIYKKFLSEFALIPEKTLFIDDEPLNREAAKLFGIEVLKETDMLELAELLA
ncbi:MAG: HAD-IA family hydrolase [Bdellovibrionia bacterium]